MKSSKSHKNIAIITDQTTGDHTLHKCQSIGNLKSTRNVKPMSTQSKRNMAHKNQLQNGCKPQTCRNNDGIFSQMFKSKDKIRSRQNSNLQSSQYSENQSNINEYRKKQVDWLCLQRIISQMKKFLFDCQESWDLQKLNYHQLIKILWLFRYISFDTQNDFLRHQQNQQLKKVYYLWLAISIKMYFTLYDLIVIICVIENFEINSYILKNLIQELKDQLNPSNQLLKINDRSPNPQYIFFLKKQILTRSISNELELTLNEKDKIAVYLKTFKLNKLKNTSNTQCVQQEEIQHQFVSKRSSELADSKRKKMEQKIKCKNPQISSINLLDILTFRERDYNQKNNSIVHIKSKNKKSQTNKPQIKKQQLQQLSRPKICGSDKSADLVKFKKNEAQYTFHPKISQYSQNDQKKKGIWVKNVKNGEKVVLRMREAQKIKQQKQNILEKGWTNHNCVVGHRRNSAQSIQKKSVISNPKNQIFPTHLRQKCQNNKLHQLLISCQDPDISEKFNSMSSMSLSQPQNKSNIDNKQNFEQESKQQNQDGINDRKLTQMSAKTPSNKYQVCKDYLRIPLLYIDVNIDENRKERIVIYDNDRAQVLAKQFTQKHGLNQDMMSKLQLLLQQQMDTVLSRIQQEEDLEEQCSYIW